MARHAIIFLCLLGGADCWKPDDQVFSATEFAAAKEPVKAPAPAEAPPARAERNAEFRAAAAKALAAAAQKEETERLAAQKAAAEKEAAEGKANLKADAFEAETNGFVESTGVIAYLTTPNNADDAHDIDGPLGALSGSPLKGARYFGIAGADGLAPCNGAQGEHAHVMAANGGERKYKNQFDAIDNTGQLFPLVMRAWVPAAGGDFGLLTGGSDRAQARHLGRRPDDHVTEQHLGNLIYSKTHAEVNGVVADPPGHNVGLICDQDGRIFVFGGRCYKRPTGNGDKVVADCARTGIFRYTWPSTATLGEQATGALAVSGGHPGNVEKRKGFDCAEYDGKLSVARLSGRGYFLYARANLHEEGGARFVQATNAQSLDAPESGWGAFHKIEIEGYSASVHASNVYIPAVNTNPVHDKSLLGFWTLCRGGQNVCDLSLTLSCDGIHFGAPLKVADIPVYEADHRPSGFPVDGIIMTGSGQERKYHLMHHQDYFNENVLGAGEAGNKRSRIIRHTVSEKRLRRYTEDSLKSIPSCPKDIALASADSNEGGGEAAEKENAAAAAAAAEKDTAAAAAFEKDWAAVGGGGDKTLAPAKGNGGEATAAAEAVAEEEPGRTAAEKAPADKKVAIEKQLAEEKAAKKAVETPEAGGGQPADSAADQEIKIVS